MTIFGRGILCPHIQPNGTLRWPCRRGGCSATRNDLGDRGNERKRISSLETSMVKQSSEPPTKATALDLSPEPETVQIATASKDDERKIKEPSGKADFYGENEEIQEQVFDSR